MKKPFSLISFLAILFLTIACGTQKNKTPEPDITMNTEQDNKYTPYWKVIDSLEQQGLPRSAQEKLMELYEIVKKDENPAQTVKCLVYQSKYIAQLEEDGLVKSIYKMEQEMLEAKPPIQSFLQSLLGEMYLGYLDNNYWRFGNRTQTQDFNNEDIRTWTVEQLLSRGREMLQKSLEDKNTQQFNIGNFGAVIYPGNGAEGLRPTLYDLLAHRAIDLLSNERNYLAQPAYVFKLNQPEALASVATFVQYDFISEDKTSQKLQIIKIFQELLAFHQNDQTVSVLVDADLKRLKFVHNHSTLLNKDELYVESLRRMSEQYANDPASAHALYKLARHYFNQGNTYQPIVKEEVKWDIKKAKELAEQGMNAFPESYGGKSCKALITSILRREIEVQVEVVNLPEKPILSLFGYRNIPKVHVRIASITKQQEGALQRMQEQERHDFLRQLDPVQSWAADLPSDGDFQQHSLELKIESLPLGRYIVMASPEASFSNQKNTIAYTFTQVSNISYWSRRNIEGNTEFILAHRKSGEPMAGVKAIYSSQKYNNRSRQYNEKKEGEALSDENGMIRTKLPYNGGYLVRFIKGDDELDLGDNFSNYKNNRRIKEETTTHFFLDRAIYRPGQTIYFKGIMVRKDSKRMPSILANEKVTIVFYDTNRQKIKELNLRTNEYGTINGSFTAPDNGLLGRMSIAANSGRSNHYFRVEEYKRPKFEANIKPVEGSFKLGEFIEVEGNAKAFAGSNIDGAKVVYRVVREASYPYLPWYYRRWGFPSSPSMEIVNGETVTAADGSFKVKFKAIPDDSIDPKKKPQFNYTVYADVIDLTGETRSAQRRVSVGYVSMRAGFTLADKMNVDSLNKINIYANNLSGKPLEVKGKVIIQKLRVPERSFINRYWSRPDLHLLEKADFYQSFDHYAYKNEDQVEEWEVLNDVKNVDFDTKNATSIDLTQDNFSAGKYALILRATDPYGEKVEVIKYLTLYDLKQKNSATNDAIFHVQEKSIFEPGETATYYLCSYFSKLPVYYELAKGSDLLENKWLHLEGKEKLTVAIKEAHRGNLQYQYTFVRNNRIYAGSRYLNVPWSNKELKFEYATFRDKLYPGEEEQWQIKVSGLKKEKVAAEMVAAMYDASLDEFAANNWNLNLFPQNYGYQQWRGSGFSSRGSNYSIYYWNIIHSNPSREYPRFIWHGYNFYNEYANRRLKNRRGGAVEMDGVRTESGGVAPAPAMAEAEAMEDSAELAVKDVGNVAGKVAGLSAEDPNDDTPKEEQATEKAPQIRRNLKETVFFFPDLRTDANGDVIINFTMNEALTRWKFLGLAHTKDLMVGTTSNSVVTQKDLMVQPNPPRFFRESDEIEFTAKVSNLTENEIQGTATLELFDALTMKPIDALLSNTNNEINFTAKAGQSDRLAWRLKVPVGQISAITHRVVAKAKNFSDGEEDTAPVLSNRMLVTETKPLPLRGQQDKTFVFQSMKDKAGSSTLQHHRLTLEFTANPAWYAVQALPYLMEYPYECTEQIFSRYYANSLATSVANSHPRIKDVFDRWKNTPAMQSNLSKNEELKSALLEETPWVLNAQSEEEQKKNIGLLFDLNRMSKEQAKAMTTLVDRQMGSGAFSWFPGGRDSWYITQYIVEGMGHLNELGVKDVLEEERTARMVKSAINYCDGQLQGHYEKLVQRVKRNKEKLEDNHLDAMAIHYLYARSFFADQKINGNTQTAFDYYLGQAEKYWLNRGMYQEGMIALALQRFAKPATPAKIVKSLKERSLQKEEMGMYWKYNTGYYWYQLPIETHALMIEVFDEVAKDEKAVEELKIWLLKTKQTTHWKTTKATAAAVYALLRRGDNWLLEDQPITLDWAGKTIESNKMPGVEAGTGYFKYALDGEAISEAKTQNGDQALYEIKVSNPNKNPAWGALYWQYFEQLDKIDTFEETPLTIKKQLFKVENSATGPVMTPLAAGAVLEPGDKVNVRIEIRVDRMMEYVHLKDMRASGFEPINVLSQYKWQGGLGYYESTRDASTNFFIGYLPKGTHVFEYPLRTIHKGDFSNGITTIQCMYAPEFTSHSEGIRVQVK